MKKTNFNGIDSVCYKVIDNGLVKEEHSFYFVSNWDDEKVRVHKDGKFEILTEKTIAIELLNKGKGIVYQGFVLFKDDDNNEVLKVFKERYSKTLEGYKSFMDGEVYKNIKEVDKTPLVKSIIKLYIMNIISEDGLIARIKSYFKLENFSIEEFVSKINEQRDMLLQP